MEFLIPSVKIIHIVLSVLLVLIILFQPSKSGDIGSMFGGGSSESVFGSSGAMPFLVKMTRLLGLLFVITSLFLGYTSVKSITGSVVEKSPSEMFEEFSQPNEEPSEKSPGQTPDVEQTEQLHEVKTDVGAKSAPASLADTAPAQVAPEPKDSSKTPEE